ncbi:unnamed protein product [Cyclocybe aegerita]|uniref:Transforming growth factor beta regulator 1 n=1 Tax=Cyclocybe aegerita TaxID=1973307 RepID=A0A8S0XQE0_CYCAE|nr:unnamed protein product [Cyclocybe aegerita]
MDIQEPLLAVQGDNTTEKSKSLKRRYHELEQAASDEFGAGANHAYPRETQENGARALQRRSQGGAAIAAVAAAAAEAEAAAAAQAAGRIPQTTASSLDPAMESIVKVAEAAVAAQNAAKLAASQPIQADPTLDPTLATPTATAQTDSNTSNPTPSTSSDTSGSSTATTSSTTTPIPGSLSNNPYLSLSTNLLARAGISPTTPTAHMFMPYPFFYPTPATPVGTPVTPNTPTYSIPYNPYYYLATPMAPSPNGMYPPAPGFPQAPQRPPPSPEPQKIKPKRLKAHTVVTKSFSIPMVPRDKMGKPMLPLNVGIMTVISLGQVCLREHFHTERYIFPVGYEVTRRYLSTIDPSIEVVYHCTILDGGDGPKFQIIPADRPDKPVIAGTATGAWSNIVKQANAIRNRQHSNSVSGPDFFGLGQNTIKHLIQELPNTDRLRDYVWQNFVEGGPLGGRHAAVIPALPEEYDASMPIGAYYPRRDSSDPSVPRGLSHYPQHIIAQAQKAAQANRETDAHSAGSSNSASSPSSSSTPQQMTPGSSQNGQPQIILQSASNGHGLTIQQYQPPLAQPQAQAQAQTQAQPQRPEKRTTRSSAAASASASAGPARSTRSTARGSQQQQAQQASQPQPQQPPQHQQQPISAPAGGFVVTNGTPMLNADGTMPTTFVGIMSAYPIPANGAVADSMAAPT